MPWLGYWCRRARALPAAAVAPTVAGVSSISGARAPRKARSHQAPWTTSAFTTSPSPILPSSTFPVFSLLQPARRPSGIKTLTHNPHLTSFTTTPSSSSSRSVRVFQTFSPSRAFTRRMQRLLLQKSYPSYYHRRNRSTLLLQRSNCASPTPISNPTKRPRLIVAIMGQLRGHSDHSHHNGHGHSHGHSHVLGHHHHHHDNVYLTSKNKSDAGVRITRIGLYSNLGMAIAKGAGGYAFNSQSMIADAWHSLTDLASDFLTLATVSWSLKPPTKLFPQGFGKVESLGSLGVSGMLLVGGLFMCLSSCQSLYAQLFLDPEAAKVLMEHGHGHHHHHHHHHGEHGGAPSLHAAWLAAGTVAIKEWLYHATMKVARERKSSVLASNAVHHRVDSLTGIVALLAILGANLLHEATWLDPVGGLFISLLVIRAGASNTLSALYELADRSIDAEVQDSVAKHAHRALDELAAATGGSISAHEVQLVQVSGVKSGQNYLVDVELAVPGDWTVERVRRIEEAVRERVGKKVRGVRRLRVRFVPKMTAAEQQEVKGLLDEFILGDESPRSSPEPEEVEDHDHHDHDGHDHAKRK